LSFVLSLSNTVGQWACRLYAFILITNHVYLLALGETSSDVSGLMQSVGRRYVRYLLTYIRYIDLNPVRAGMVTKPEDYRWSSHRRPIAASAIDGLSEPEEYRRLAASPRPVRWLITPHSLRLM